LCTNHDDCVKINYYFNGICSRCGVPSRCYLISSTANSGCRWGRSRVANTYTKGSCASAASEASREESKALNAHSSITIFLWDATETFVLYGFAIVGLISILAFLQSAYRNYSASYKVINEATKLEESNRAF